MDEDQRRAVHLFQLISRKKLCVVWPTEIGKWECSHSPQICRGIGHPTLFLEGGGGMGGGGGIRFKFPLFSATFVILVCNASYIKENFKLGYN